MVQSIRFSGTTFEDNIPFQAIYDFDDPNFRIDFTGSRTVEVTTTFLFGDQVTRNPNDEIFFVSDTGQSQGIQDQFLSSDTSPSVSPDDEFAYFHTISLADFDGDGFQPNDALSTIRLDRFEIVSVEISRVLRTPQENGPPLSEIVETWENNYRDPDAEGATPLFVSVTPSSSADAVVDQFTPLFGFDVTPLGDPADTVVELRGLTSGNSARTEGGRVFNNGDGTVTYAPLRGFTGTDSFEVVREGGGGEVTDTIEFLVRPIGLDLEIARLTGYLFEAGLGRLPTTEGLNFNAGRILEGGESENALARAFLNSDEFEELAGDAPEALSDRELVEQLFLNVLDRPGAETGIQNYVDQLEDGLPRERLLIAFAQSPENMVGSPEVASIVELADGSFDFA